MTASLLRPELEPAMYVIVVDLPCSTMSESIANWFASVS
jgi:hypothetical protein